MTNVTIRGIQSLSGYAAFDQNYGTTSMYIDDTPITSGQMPDRQNGGVMFDMERVKISASVILLVFALHAAGGTPTALP